MSAEANGTDPGDDELPDPEVERKWVAERLREVGVSTQRFIDVHDGAKGTTNHTQHEPDADALSGNYGVYGGPGGDSDVVTDPDEFEGDPAEDDVLWLVDVDVDDYENDGDEPTAGLESLPETFTIESPHTDGSTGGHRYYAVRGHVAAAFADAYGKPNPSPEWGEVRVHNQMCVGPGSQILPGGCVHEWCDACKGCDKEWCDECAKPDGGFYRIAENREIAVLELETFVEAILRDLDGGDTDADTDADADADDEFDADLDLDLDLDFPYRDLYYIKLIDGEKNPIKSWGGYSQDYAEAENVYTHDQVLDSDHMRWGIVGIENDARSLLIYDLDLYKAPDFDADEITVDGTEGIPVVESGSGGLHAYTAVYEERTAGSESGFEIDADLPFDIDIRGSFVSHHVVAPTEIPGVESEYTLVHDAPIMTRSDPRDSASALKYADSGDPIITYDPSGGVGTIDFDRAADPPDDTPTCYARGLELRAASPDDHPNSHKVNTLTALCGLAAGYDVETMIGHFVEEYPPDDPNRKKTEYHLKHMLSKVDRGDLVPPSISTLREWGILDDDETCDCEIEYHGGTVTRHAFATWDADADSDDDDGSDDLDDLQWFDVKQCFDSGTPGSTTRGYALAAQLLNTTHAFAAIRESGELYYFDPDLGYYVRKGETFVDELLERNLAGYMNSERRTNIYEIIVTLNYVSMDEFTPPRGKVCVKNGVLDLDTRDLESHSPEYYFTNRLQTPYDPDAEAELWAEFLRESVSEDTMRKLEEFIGYTLEGWHHNREKNLFVVGPRQSGKSTFADTVQALFGEMPTVSNLTPQQIADTQFDAASLKDAALNAVNDINTSQIKDSGTLKRVFSGERLKLERKYQDATFGEPKAKHVFTANWLPIVVGRDESLYRRVLIAEFLHSLSDDEKDRELKRKLRDELPGILNRALDARDRLHEQNHFTNDRDTTATRQKWDSWLNSYKRFLYTQFHVTGDEDDDVGKKTFYRAYKEYAGRKGYTMAPQQAVTKSLKNVPEIEVRDDVYRGITWRDEDAAETTTSGSGGDCDDRDDGQQQTSLDTTTDDLDEDSDDSGADEDQNQNADVPQDELTAKIRSWVIDGSDIDNGADRETVLDTAEEHGLDRERVADRIETLMNQGALYSLSQGKLRICP